MTPRRSPARRRAAATSPPRRRTGSAETGLLALARELAELGRTETTPRRQLEQALERVSGAFVADGPLPRALAEASREARASKPALLALAWAREQVRLGLAEIVERAARVGAARAEPPADTLAWLLLAGFEAVAHEPPEARPDRVRALTALVVREHG